MELDARRHDKGHQIEGQYILEQPRYNLTAGLGYSDIDTREERSALIFNFFDQLPPLPPGFPPPPPNPIDASAPPVDSETEHTHAYLYSNINVTDAVTATLVVPTTTTTKIRSKSRVLPKAASSGR